MTDPLLITSAGAIGDGKTDNQEAIAYAFKVAKAEGRSVQIPKGSFAHSDVVNVDGVSFTGEGDESILYALNPDRAAIMVSGSGARIASMRLSGVKPTARASNRESCRVMAIGATDCWIKQLLIDTASGCGIRADKCNGVTIDGNRINGTLADSIHITAGSTNLDVIANLIDSSGDDGVAVVSYKGDGVVVSKVRARGNRITNNKGGRCMSVVGGTDIEYSENFMSGNSISAGLYLAQEKAYHTFGIHRVLAQNNTIRACGNVQKSHYAVMLFSDGEEANSDVTLRRNLVVNDSIGSIRVFGPQTVITLDQNVPTTPMQLAAGVVLKPYVSGPVGAP